MRGGRSFEGRGDLVLIKRERDWRGAGRGGGRTGGQFVRGSYKSFKGINLTVLEKRRKKCTRLSLGGAGVGRVGQLNLCVETIHSLKGINVAVLERMHQFIMYILR